MEYLGPAHVRLLCQQCGGGRVGRRRHRTVAVDRLDRAVRDVALARHLAGRQDLSCAAATGTRSAVSMLQLLPAPDGVQVQRLFELAPKQFNSEQQTPIFFDGHLVGIRKQDRGRLVCLDLEGKEIWNSGKDRFGHGPYMIADGVILALSNEGELVMAEASTAAYRPLARYQVFADGHDAWGPMALGRRTSDCP